MLALLVPGLRMGGGTFVPVYEVATVLLSFGMAAATVQLSRSEAPEVLLSSSVVSSGATVQLSETDVPVVQLSETVAAEVQL